MSSIQNIDQITLSLFNEGYNRTEIDVFKYLYQHEQNEIKKSISTMSEESGIKPRTLRDVLYRLDEKGLIEYNYDNPGKVNTTILRKYRHADGQTD